MNTAVNVKEARLAFHAGRAYSFVVPAQTSLGSLEDVLAALSEKGIEFVGYDVTPDLNGCRIQLLAEGPCTIDADLDHVDLRMHRLGDDFDFSEAKDPDEECHLSLVDHDFALVFRWAEALVPKRYADEEFGDALEEIHAALKRGCSIWWVRLKVLSTVLWVLCHIAVEEFARYKRKR